MLSPASRRGRIETPCDMITQCGEPGFPGSPFFIGKQAIADSWRSGSNLDSEAGSLKEGRGQTTVRSASQVSRTSLRDPPLPGGLDPGRATL